MIVAADEEPPGSRTCSMPRRTITACSAQGAGIRRLSDRLASAQRPLRILDAVRWDEEVEQSFFASGCRELPRIDRAWYLARALPFDVQEKLDELATLRRDVQKQFSGHPAGRIMLRRCGELVDVVELLRQRGTTRFAELSKRLFGGSEDLRAPSLGEFARLVGDDFITPDCGAERTLDAWAAARILSERLSAYFLDGPPVRVQVSACVTADAAAGGDHLKLRAGARFSLRDVRLLEVHEGWVHLGTTRNGLKQPVCTFLSKPLPSSTVTQEGLAVLTEVLAFASHPTRLRRLANRVEAVALAENGGDFLDVFRFFQEQGCDDRESYQHSARIFRGSLPNGGPFTKDLAYSKGFALVVRYLCDRFARGEQKSIPLLFSGKTCLDDMPDLEELAALGLVAAPRQAPPSFDDLRRLTGLVGRLAGPDEKVA
jgi:uncharacterized protein (TIGR02421 family)